MSADDRMFQMLLSLVGGCIAVVLFAMVIAVPFWPTAPMWLVPVTFGVGFAWFWFMFGRATRDE